MPRCDILSLRSLAIFTIFLLHFQIAFAQIPPQVNDAPVHGDEDLASLIDSLSKRLMDEPKATDLLTPEEMYRRSIIDDIGKGMEGIGSAIGKAVGGNNSILDAIAPIMGGKNSSFFNWAKDLLSGAGGTLDTLGGLIQGNFTELTVPAQFLGIGVGQGVVGSMNLTTKANADQITKAAVDASGESISGLNGMVLNLGKGLASVIIPSLSKGNGGNSSSGNSSSGNSPSGISSSGNSSSGGLLSKIDLPAIAKVAGTGLADGIGTTFKPILGTSVFDVSINNTFKDLFGSVAYAFTRGLSSEVSSWGMGFLGIWNGTVSPSLARRSEEIVAVQNYGSPEFRRDVTSSMLQNSTKTNEIVSNIAQSAISMLQCRGVGNAVSIAGVVSSQIKSSRTAATAAAASGGGGGGGARGNSNITLPPISVGVWNDGNYFTVDLKEMAIAVNGVTLNNLVILIAVHVIIMVLALLFLLPASLIIEAIKGFFIMIGRPMSLVKVDRWLNILQGIVPVLSIVGIVFGVMAGGNAARFRTIHGRFGLAVFLLSLGSSILSIMRRMRDSKANTYPPPKSAISLVEALLTGSLLVLIFVAWTTGIDDLRATSLCIVDQISISIAAAAGGLLTILWDSVLVVQAIEWWLRRQVYGKKENTHLHVWPEKKGTISMVYEAPVDERHDERHRRWDGSTVSPHDSISIRGNSQRYTSRNSGGSSASRASRRGERTPTNVGHYMIPAYYGTGPAANHSTFGSSYI